MKICSILAPSYFCDANESRNTKRNIKKIGFDEFEDFRSKEKLLDKWAGSANERLEKFYSAWDSDSDAIMCCKGGSGVLHFLPLIKKYKLRRKKLFIGHSDITPLLVYLNLQLGIITIHGPNLSKNIDKISLLALKDALKMKNYGLEFKEFTNETVKILKGRTIGGNLGRLVESFPYISLDFRGKIVFLEEVGFTEYKIFNLLVSLKNHPYFKPKALVFGGLGIKNNKLMKIMIEYLFSDIPLIFNMNFGHTTPNLSIPIGANCEIDFKERKIGFSFPKKHRRYAVKFF